MSTSTSYIPTAKKYLKWLFLLCLVTILVNFFLTYFVTKYDSYHDLKRSKNRYAANRVDGIDTTLSKATSVSDFHAGYILDSVLRNRSYDNLIVVLNSMDSSHVVGFESRFVDVLTDSLYAKCKSSWTEYNPAELNEHLQWAEKLKNYGEVDQKNDRLFSAISIFWINKVSERLDSLSIRHSSLKFNHSFNFLVSRCSENNNKPNIRTDNLEKTIRYISERKWVYMWGRLNEGTSLFYKCLVFLMAAIVAFGFYCTFLFIKRRL